MDVRRAINELLKSVREPRTEDRVVVLESSDLRTLDAALWTYAGTPDWPPAEEE